MKAGACTIEKAQTLSHLCKPKPYKGYASYESSTKPSAKIMKY